MKKYLNELNKDELKLVLERNQRLLEMVSQELHELNMEYQAEEFDNMNIKKYVELKDDYNSFYLTLKSPIDLYQNIDISYCNSEVIDYYNNSKKYYDDYCSCDDCDISDKIYDIFEERMKHLVELIEKQLHEHEELSNFNEVLEYFIEEIACGYYDDIYIFDETYIASRDVCYVECFK